MKFWLLLLSALAGAQTAVWIDTDPSISKGPREVDDGFALIQAFRSPELRIVGISTVFGNAPLAQADPIGRRIVKRFAPNIPIYTGAGKAQQAATPATEALAAALANERLTVLALGPGTNIGAVLAKYPDRAKNVDRVIAVAGRRPGQSFKPTPNSSIAFRDFNFECDPDSFQQILDSGVPLILAPWEVSSKVWLTSDDLARLAKGPASARWLVKPGRDWLAMWQKQFAAPGFNPFDSLAVGYVTHRDLLVCERGSARIEQGPDDTKPGSSKALLIFTKGAGPVEYCYDVKPLFHEVLMERLLATP